MVKVTLGGWVWSPGQQLVDLEVFLGQNEYSSGCTITLSDPTGEIASALIDHSISSGGIQPLSEPLLPAATTVRATDSVPVARGAEFSPRVLAFLDLLAYKEVPLPLSVQGYFTLSINSYFSEIEASRGFPVSAGSRNVGRYQFNRNDWNDFRKAHPDVNDFLPVTQDRMVIWKMKAQNKGWRELMAGDVRGAILKAGKEWATLPGSPYGQVPAGYTMEQALAYYQERLRHHQNTASMPQPTPKVEPSPQSQAKGSKIIVTWGEAIFEFFHQGTFWDNSGITRVSGQSVRWILSRRPRNKSIRNTTLRVLATKVASAHGLRLDWQSTYDPIYEHIDQSGISDYQLLLREASFAGLWVSEEAGRLVIKSRDKIRDSGFYVAAGSNLISYQIEDRAIDLINSENTPLLQNEPKSEIDPLSGQLVPRVPDVDHTKSADVTGAEAKIAGKPAPGQDAILAQNRARMVRIKGLPSQFVVLLEAQTLLLRPMDAVRTRGFTGTLNRIWMIDRVVHKLADNTTTLEVYSPIEILSEQPEMVQPTQPQTAVPTAGWVYPATGTVTSLYGSRKAPISGASKNHKGVDIANSLGTPIFAAGGGIAFWLPGYNGGAGNMVIIRHDNGYTTRYFHLADNSAQFSSGQRVNAGQQVAAMGTTGRSTGYHLHFEVLDPSGRHINPAIIFPKFGRRFNNIIGGTPL